jgi:hypothetical protein
LIEYMMKPSGSSSVADGSMLMCELLCSSDFVMGPYYTGQGTCKSATRGEEQVSSDRPGKFIFSFLHLGWVLHCNRVLTAQFFLTIICNSSHQGSSLRGKKVHLVLHWYVMPNAGAMTQGRMALSEFKLPDAYTS